MTTEELKKTIDNIITKTFTRLENVYLKHKERFSDTLPLSPSENESRLVFPAYYYDESGEKKPKGTRISEQELRFAFVEEFNYYCRENKINLYYSVETPTKNTYSDFSSDPKMNPEGRSAEFDLVIYNENLNRVCLIEFKANNADWVDHKKDFLKLENEEKDNEDVLRYFIEIVKSHTDATINSLKKDKFKYRGKLTQVRCFSLEGKSRKKTISGEDISEKFKDIPSFDYTDGK
jgi:hypothetical protein